MTGAAFVAMALVFMAAAMVIMAMVVMMFVMFMAAAMVIMTVVMVMFMVFMFVFVFVTFAGHFLILLHMGNSGAENCTDMGVIEGIIHLFSLSAVFYEPCGFKNGKLV